MFVAEVSTVMSILEYLVAKDSVCSFSEYTGQMGFIIGFELYVFCNLL